MLEELGGADEAAPDADAAAVPSAPQRFVLAVQASVATAEGGGDKGPEGGRDIPDEVSNDLLGQGYEYLLKKFADESGK